MFSGLVCVYHMTFASVSDVTSEFLISSVDYLIFVFRCCFTIGTVFTIPCFICSSFSINILDFKNYICVCACEYVHVFVGSYRGQRH